MKNLALVLFFAFSATAFAETPVLSKSAYSGFVPPEHSFSKTCTIYAEGRAESKQVAGRADVTAIRTIDMNKSVSSGKIAKLRKWIAKAQEAPATEEGWYCDGGTKTLVGYVGGKPIDLDSEYDCGKKFLVHSPAVEKIAELVEKLCEF